jgi:hypothetical protein
MTAEIKGEDFTGYVHIFILFLMRECLKDTKKEKCPYKA